MEAAKTNSAFRISDWANYSKYRPSYPPSLIKLIMQFHRAHSNSLRLAHDVGSGAGIFAVTLAEFFSHVHVSDPTASSVKLARERLSQYRAGNWWQANFSFDVTTAERSDEGLATGEVDIVTMMEAAHWVEDLDAMVQSFARQLSPNGTMAVVIYNPAFRVVGDGEEMENLKNTVTLLMRKWVHEVLDSRGGSDSLHGRTVLPQNQTGVDFVPAPDGLFIQDVTKRIRINTRGKGNTNFQIPGVEHLVAPSRVGSEHRLYEFASGEHEEAEGWQMEVDVEWFRGYIESLSQEGKMHLFEKEVEQVEAAMLRSCPNGRVTIEWTVGVLLATRK